MSSPFNAEWHLRAELSRVLEGLAGLLAVQRGRGRTPAADAVRGLVVEEGEAEGLLRELGDDLRPAGDEAGPPAPGRRLRDEIDARAAAGASQGEFLPLLHARRAFALENVEFDALVLALAVEVDARFGRLVAFLNDHAGRTRPTLGLALALAGEGAADPARSLALESRPFLRDGLLDAEGDGPWPGRPLRVSDAMRARFAVPARAGADGVRAWRPDPALLGRLVLDEATHLRLTEWSAGLRATHRARPLVLAGAEGSGRAAAARAALFGAGLPAVEIDVAAENPADSLRAARAACRWHGAALVARLGSPAPQATVDWASIWKELPSDRPVSLVLPADLAGAAAAAAPEEPAIVLLETPDAPLRARLWTALLPAGVTLSESELGEIAARFPFGPGAIARSIRRAAADLSLRPQGERRLAFTALLDAARAVDSASIGPLARKLPLPYSRAELVVPPQVAAELDLAVAWVKHRHRVLHDWAFVRRVPMGHGLTALFAGPPGTGKTMTAQVLARELGLDLYRIDASQLVSKWVGETEKNIAAAFGARVGVLFFDEADALFGKRGEAKSPQDRWANIEIGFLLQKMEEYDGVTILATNRMQDMDDAFLRRLHVVVDFPMPSEADRARIWEGMLPAEAPREGLDFAALARDYELSGGEIKNAVLAAAYMAAATATPEGAGPAPIGMEHLRRAATREQVKGGKVVGG